MMKKLFGLLLSLCLLSSLSVMAEEGTASTGENPDTKDYSVASIGITVSLPTEFEVYTKEVLSQLASSFSINMALDAFPPEARELIGLKGVSLVAVSRNSDVGFLMWQEEEPYALENIDFRIMKKRKVEQFFNDQNMKLGLNHLAPKGMSTLEVKNKKTIENDQAYYGLYTLEIKKEDGIEYSYIASTLINSKMVHFKLLTFNRELTTDEMAMLDSIVETAAFKLEHQEPYLTVKSGKLLPSQVDSLRQILIVACILLFVLFLGIFGYHKAQQEKEAIRKAQAERSVLENDVNTSTPQDDDSNSPEI